MSGAIFVFPPTNLENEKWKMKNEKFFSLIDSVADSSSVANEEEKTAAQPPAEPAGSLKFHTRPPSQLTVAMHDRLELKCDVSGAPPPVVYWLKNGQPIAEVIRRFSFFLFDFLLIFFRIDFPFHCYTCDIHLT